MFELEAGQVEIIGNVENTMGTSYTVSTPSTPPLQAECVGSPKFDPTPSSFAMTRTVNAETADSPENDPKPSVSNCYVFKSRLQEYCQKAGLTTPTYETIREGPSHEPSFKSTVIVHDVRYDSLPGFFNRKAAEQSAAEVALLEIANSADTKFGMSQHVHETGLCKNLLQEYAQKMNYAIPLYECHKEDNKKGRTPMYSCTVEIGGIKYMGAATTTKKEAEIKAARTALLAIQSACSTSGDQSTNSIYTVRPQKKGSSTSDLGFSTQETAAALKTKKRRFKKSNRNRKKRFAKRVKSCANGDDGAAHVTTAGDPDHHNDNAVGLGGAGCGVMETNTDFCSVVFDNGNVERGDNVGLVPPHEGEERTF